MREIPDLIVGVDFGMTFTGKLHRAMLHLSGREGMTADRFRRRMAKAWDGFASCNKKVARKP